MKVRIPTDLFVAHRDTLEKKFGLQFRNWQTYSLANLRSFDEKQLEKLRDLFAKTDEIRGAKTLIRDISTWLGVLTSKSGGKKAKARSLQQSEALLIEYLRKAPRHHLYKRVDQGANGVFLSYYVCNIEYQQPYRGSAPYVRINLAAEAFGLVETSSIILNANDVIGKTAPQILIDKGYTIETPPMRSDYEYFLDLYKDYKDQIGAQFLATGSADSEGIDGNEDDDDDRWWRRDYNNIILEKDGEPGRVVIDVYRETDKDKDEKDDNWNAHFWNTDAKSHDDDDADPEVEITGDSQPELPIHPFIPIFDLKRHLRLKTHVGNLTPYEYDTNIRKKLVLPEKLSSLIDTLLLEKESHFKDLVIGKSGGTVILLQGPPGTGKTLTGEIYSEALERPLYTIQCSQLGTDSNTLEKNLMKVLTRGRRWGAVMLLDEADVYVHERGDDLQQNAIVGVFLRVLEYHSGVLFLTTNRGDLVDDAILSRCTARVPYSVPEPEEQEAIWMNLTNENKLGMSKQVIRKIVKDHPKFSGRDIKNVLKLAMMVARDRNCEIDSELIDEVKQFKPTTADYYGK